MATFNFPLNPSLNDEYTYQNRTWIWNGVGWQVKPTTFYGTRTVNTFTGDGTTTNFALSTKPTDENAVTVNYQGILQLHDAYTINGNYIIFDTAPEDNVKVEVIVDTVASSGTPVATAGESFHPFLLAGM